MNTIICLWFIGAGILAVLRPGIFYRKEALQPERIERNNRIWRVCGAGLIALGIAGVIIELLRR